MAGVGSWERIPGCRPHSWATQTDGRWRRGVLEGTIGLVRVSGRIEGAGYSAHWRVGVRRVHRRRTVVSVISFVRAHGYTGRGAVSCIAGHTCARFGPFQCGAGRRSVAPMLRFYGRHATTNALGRGRAGAVNDGLLQRNQRLCGGFPRVTVQRRLSWEYVGPVDTNNKYLLLVLQNRGRSE